MFLLVAATIAFTIAIAVYLVESTQPKLGSPSILYPSVATSLFERANAIKGQNPSEAKALRASALAFLSVAR